MDRTSLKILDNNLTFIGDIEDYISFYFVRNFFYAKEFQLVAPLKYTEILKEDNYIYLSKYKSMIIEEIEINEDEETITAKGRDIKSIIEARITEPPLDEAYDKKTAEAEEVIKYYVDRNCINPLNPERKIEYLVLAENKKRGKKVSWQTRYKNLAREIETIANATGLGWFIYLDVKNKKLIFEVEEGIDRTEGQSQNSRVIFSNDFGNISKATHKRSSSNYKNIGYVGGQGEGTEREIKIITKGNFSGIKRREVFIDARDISESDSLEDRGRAKLSEYDYILNTESKIINKNLLYEIDWNLGDIITVKNSFEKNDLRITEVREIYEDNREIEITVGTLEGTIIDNINNSIVNIANEGSLSTGNTGDKNYIHTQISASNVWRISHSLNKYPSVVIVDSSGSTVVGEVKYIDKSNIEVSFSVAFVGYAYLN